jgi:hypothetical protein
MSGSIANAHYSAWSRGAFDVCNAIDGYLFRHFTFSHIPLRLDPRQRGDERLLQNLPILRDE